MGTYSLPVYHNMEFHIEQWDDDDLHVEQLLLCSMNALFALAAWDQAVEVRGSRRLCLRHRARIIRSHVPDRLKKSEATKTD